MAYQQNTQRTDNESLIRLVEMAQQGDREAFEVLFERHYRAVFATVFRRLRNEAEAQELCQEVFMQAMRKLGQLNDPLCFGGWVRAIASRMAINRAVRARSAVPIDADQFDPSYSDQETPLGEVLAKERRDQVHEGLSRLTSLDRDTLVAFYFRGQSLLEMSDSFQSPVGTIKRRLHVARKRLAKELAAMNSA